MFHFQDNSASRGIYTVAFVLLHVIISYQRRRVKAVCGNTPLAVRDVTPLVRLEVLGLFEQNFGASQNIAFELPKRRNRRVSNVLSMFIANPPSKGKSFQN